MAYIHADELIDGFREFQRRDKMTQAQYDQFGELLTKIVFNVSDGIPTWQIKKKKLIEALDADAVIALREIAAWLEGDDD